MEITYQQLLDMKMNPGWVLVKFFKNDTVTLDNGLRLTFPDAHVKNEGRYVPFHGEIVAICDEPDPEGEIVDSVIHPKINDYLFFDYKCGLDALLYSVRGDKDMLVHVSDKNIVYMLVPYELCYAYIDKKEMDQHQKNQAEYFHHGDTNDAFKYLHPINGTYLVTPVPHNPYKGLVMNKQFPMDPYRFKVERVPKTPVRYRDKSKFDPLQSGANIEPGDIVTVTAYAGNFLEFDLFKNKYGVPTCMQLPGNRILSKEIVI